MKTFTPPTDRSTESLLAEAADAFTDDLNAGRRPSIDEYADKYPQIAPIIRQVFPALAVLDASPSDAAAGGEAQTDFADLRRQRLGDFRIERELGRGGMGIVYEAHELSLDRMVALKILPFASLLDDKQLARFKNEARAAATLSHPNIVPIYSVGSDRGVHYYAMQLIRGQSLAETIAALSRSALPKRTSRADVAHHESVVSSQSSVAKTFPATDNEQWTTDQAATDHGQLTTDKSQIDTVAAALSTEHSTNPKRYFRRIAEIGIQIAQALDHAHEQGVLHRDVKPANILLDHHGKAWITDFGLARIGPDAGLTLTGDVVGTLRYMSPEQVSGQSAVVDHRTDVYSLGITLYELATLCPAFEGNDRQTLARRIAEEDPRPARQHAPQIPPDLETIILKAIERDPKDRFASTAEFADDLRRLLDHQAIHARRPSLIARGMKWTRRHPAFLIAATLVLAVSLLASLAAFAVATSAQRKTAAALDEKTDALALAATQRRRAEQNFDLARETVDDLYIELGTFWMANETGPSLAQKNFLDRAYGFYQRIAQQPVVTLQDRERAMIAYTRLGEIAEYLEAYPDAVDVLLNATELGTRLLAENAKSATYRHELIDAHRLRAAALSELGRQAEAEQSYEAAHAIAQSLAKDFPANVNHRKKLIYCELDYAKHLAQLGELTDAEAMVTTGRDRARELDSAMEKHGSPNEARYLRLSGDAVLSRVYWLQGRYEEGHEVCSRALRFCRQFRSMKFSDARLLYDLEIRLMETLADLAYAAGELDQAESLHRESLEAQQNNFKGGMAPAALMRASLGSEVNADAAWEPAEFCRYVYTQLRLARLLAEMGRLEEAEELLDLARPTTFVLRSESEAVPPKYHVVEANAWATVAELLSTTRPQEAQAAAQHAALLWRGTLSRCPDARNYRSGLHGTQSDFRWFTERFPEHDLKN